MTALIEEITFQEPFLLFQFFKELQGAIFLDSAQLSNSLSRYSFILFDPFLIFSSKNGFIQKNKNSCFGNPWQLLKEEFQKWYFPSSSNLFPFEGGMAGYFGYELAQHLENIPLALNDDIPFPNLLLGFYDCGIAFDVIAKKTWVFSNGFPEQGSNRIKRAKKRLRWILNTLNSGAPPGVMHPLSLQNSITSNFTQEAYLIAVKKTIEYIKAGDIFQANISQRFYTQLFKIHAFDLYAKLRIINPAPFAAYLNFHPIYLMSASPERFIQLVEGQLEARPIKGTHKRGTTPKEDLAFAEILLNSEKDRSENVMIVDLMRNDLSKISKLHTVEVTELCHLKSFPTVHHLVSTIKSELKEKLTPMDVLTAIFPGGSITGAPKIRAMEIIAEIEPTQRGPYCGSIGYISFTGNLDLSITIRTFCLYKEHLTFQVGGAIVADSDPMLEYLETLTKAKALLLTLEPNHDLINR